ncbi:Voltage-gated Ion Channel (VIC) Superfamily [Phytophthora cinnamomi]|uniref:Voltage-gated Ion Channel (VIC) Superfamily n=1 Tax=Phytophthora cinnamomi TaxID=4785 RepID=UPI00355AC619|nr:Voltage-gated Ion Channel (VIC) Superfamily [Phytophthora cinnamomi]
MATARGEQQRLLPREDDELDVELSVRDARVVAMSTPKRRASLRADVWTLLHYRTSLKTRSGLQRASYVFEVCVLVLITLNVVLAMYVSASPVGAAPVTTSDWYEVFLYVSTALFTVEYLLRLWSCVEDDRFPHPICGRLKWMFRPMSVIDLVVLLPFYLEILLEKQVAVSSRGVLTLRGFRLLRIMSFLHLEHSYQAMKNLREIFAAKKEELGVVSYMTIVIVLTSSTTIFFLENPAQPEVFSSIGTCSWWAIETITSLGYGDIVPITAAGRAFSSLLALWGIILFTIPGAVLGSGFVEVMLRKQELNSEQAMEESIRISLTRELRSLSSSTIAFTGNLDSPKTDLDSPSATPSFSMPPSSFSTPHNYPAFAAPAPPIVRLQEQVDRLTATQVQLQAQLSRQETQLQTIMTLLEQSLAKDRPAGKAVPPFSAIVPPE